MQLFLVRSNNDVSVNHGGRPYEVASAFNGITLYPLQLIREKGDMAHYDALFDQVSEVVSEARAALEAGHVGALGRLMDENHDLLIEMGVSSRKLDDLVETARFAGALGAKLSGAGRGGNMIALVEEELVKDVAQALTDAGAARVICTTVT